MGLSYADFEFVRPAGAALSDDAELVKECGSLWLSPDGGLHWIHPSSIRTTPGMTDKMRDAFDMHAEANQGDYDAPWDLHPLETGDVVGNPDAPAAEQVKVSIIEGRTDDWRWFVVEDEDDQIVVLDNKPRVEREHAEVYDQKGSVRPGDHKLPVYLETARIPAAQFKAIATAVFG